MLVARCSTATIALFLAQSLSAQVASVRVQGVAFDSLRGLPLSAALVAILGFESSATTDARGRFSFERVPAGTHTFVVQHPTLDSIGFSGLSRRIAVANGTPDVRLGIPSFATLWRAACGGRSPPKDSGLVFGTIRNVADLKPVVDAFVDLTWIDIGYERVRGVRRRAHRWATNSDSSGGYVVCGVPSATWLRIDAGMPSGASGRIDLPPVSHRVQRRDLMLGWANADSTKRGVIAGHVSDPEGRPFENARVVLDDSTEVRSGSDGRFTIGNVLAGTRQVEVLSIGVVPVVSALDVFPGDTTTFAVQLRRVTTLDVVQVTASRRGRRIAAEIAERRRSGFAQTAELGELMAHSTMATVFADFAGVTVEKGTTDFVVWVPDGRGGQCAPPVWIDGARMEYAALNMLRPREITAVEIFVRPTNVPMQYRPVEIKSGCGVILIWTNWAFGR